MIRSKASHLKAFALSHPGMSGKNNEDRYAVSAYRLGPTDATPSVLAVLCDGIGGHRAGEVAAEIAVDTISHTIAESSGRQPLTQLQAAVSAASERIYAAAQNDSEHQGMGATCACAWVIGDRLYTTSVGDSRIYLLRGATITQLTTDHTWVQEAIERGVIQPEEARGHPNAHIIRRFIGSPSPPPVDFRLRLAREMTDTQAEASQGARLQPGDRLLLCSDGLTDLVDDAEILHTLYDRPLPEAVQSLIDLANARGGHDNITIIVLEVPIRRRALIPTGNRRPVLRWPIVALGCGGVAVVLLALGYFLFSLGLIDLRLLNLYPAASPTPTRTPTLPSVLQTVLPATPGLPGAAPYAPTPGTDTPIPGTATPTPWPTITLPAGSTPQPLP